MDFLSGFLVTLFALNCGWLTSAEVIMPHVVTSCEGEVQRLFCVGGVISVQSATFGRSNRDFCSAGHLGPEISNVACSINVPLVATRCNGQTVCEIDTNLLAKQDPCVGTFKYFTTRYVCISAETSVTCNNGYGNLGCENGVIQIQTANYGRTDKVTCSEGRPNTELQNTNCYCPEAVSIVDRWCNGKSSCQVYASTSVFPDRCVGTYKYLAVSYTCVPPPLLSAVICENSNATLTCGERTVINVHSANYGRTDSTTCSAGKPANQLDKTDCYSSNSMQIVNAACNGKVSCVLTASNAVFSDPCVGTYKYLAVSYACAPPIFWPLNI